MAAVDFVNDFDNRTEEQDASEEEHRRNDTENFMAKKSKMARVGRLL